MENVAVGKKMLTPQQIVNNPCLYIIHLKTILVNIHIFKTNITNINHVLNLSRYIANIDGIKKWNIDLQDCDKVLRVEALNLSPYYISTVVQMAGYYCVEME